MPTEVLERVSMSGERNTYRITLIDRFVHFRHRILDGFPLGGNKAVLITRKSGRLSFILKFWYPGNVQYHAMDSAELEKSVGELEMVRKSLAD
ncbi:MAG: hypothetical protein P1U49_01370 [Minwuia sp.]|nr:hypothetical protein [Minwuia sp.]